MMIDEKYNSLYNAIINAKSAEELWQLRETLKENNDIIDSSDKMCIRCFSYNEYEKHLMNSSLDGSINIKDENVFHFCDTKGASGLLYYYSSEATAYDSRLYNNPNIDKRYVSGNRYFGHVVFIYELISNNTNNNCMLRKTMKSVLDIFYAHSGSLKYGRTDFEISRDDNKKSTGYLNQRTPAINGLVEEIRYTYDILFCFRPVFQYVDNNKSTNMFS